MSESLPLQIEDKPEQAPTAPRPRRRTWLWLGVFLALIIVSLGWVSVRALSVRSHLEKARDEASRMATALRGGNAATHEQLEALQSEAAAAHKAAHDPVWTVYAHIPLVGRSFRTIQGVSDALHRLSEDSLPQVVASADGLNRVRHSTLGNGLPVALLRETSPQLNAAAAHMNTEVARVTSLPHSLLLPGLSGAYAQARNQLVDLNGSLQAAADASSIAPGILGADGPRTYFVAFVNPAEARAGAGAGLFGAYAVITANNGKLHTELVGSNEDLPNLDDVPAGVPIEYDQRYGDIGGDTAWSNSNLSPHFPYDGQTWAAMYKAVSGRSVDGVAAIDPVALSVLLRGQPPIVLPGLGTITYRNVVRFIERDEYRLSLSGQQRKEVLKTIAKATADRITNGDTQLSALLPYLASSSDGGHLRAMSLHPSEQARIARYPVAGVLPDTDGPFAAAYVTNSSSGKLEYYLNESLSYSPSCRKNGNASITVSLRNEAPRTGLPKYVTVREDEPSYPTVPGQSREIVDVYLTRGARVTKAMLDGQDVLATTDGTDTDHSQLETDWVERRHPVAELSVELPPGHTRQLRLTVAQPEPDKNPLLLDQPLPRTSSLRLQSCH